MRISAFNRRQALMGSTTIGLTTGLGLSGLACAADMPSPEKPPIPELALFAKSPLVEHIALSPDATKAASIITIPDAKLLLIYDLNSKKVISTTKFPFFKSRGLDFIDNRFVLLTFTYTTDLSVYEWRKHEFRSGLIVNTETSKVTKQLSNYVGARTLNTKDGARLSVLSVSGVEDDFARILYSVNPSDGLQKKIYKASNLTQTIVSNSDGYILAYEDYDDVHNVWALFFNFADAGKYPDMRKINEVKQTNRPPSLIGIGRDGKCVVIEKADENHKIEFYEINADGILRPIPDPNRNTQERSPLFHPITKCFCGFSRLGDYNIHDYFDPLLKKIDEGIKATMGDDYRSYIVDFADDIRKAIVHGEGQGDAGSYYFLDLSIGRVDLVSENYPQLPKPWITQKKPIDYKAADGLNIHAYLSLPPFKNPKDLPLVVMPHGGPEARDTINYDWQVQALNARGYAVLQPNFRGSTGYGERFVMAGHGEWGRKMQTDLSDGVRYLVNQGLVDPKRVAIYGASYGGYAAIAGATMDPGVYRCAVDVAGPSDLKRMFDFINDTHASTDPAQAHYLREFLGNTESYDDISPAKQAAKAYCPILIIHGEDDTVVPIEQSREMEQALKSAGKYVELITYKGQDHWETIESTRIDMIKRVVGFIDKHNPA